VLITCVLGAKDQIKALLDEAKGGPVAPAGACDKIIATLAGLTPNKSRFQCRFEAIFDCADSTSGISADVENPFPTQSRTSHLRDESDRIAR
jgi:hypothetical protein